MAFQSTMHPFPHPVVEDLTATLLRDYRCRAGLTQEELAEISGISVRSISDLERGKTQPRPSTLRRIADSLSLTKDERQALFLKRRSPVGGLPSTPGEIDRPLLRPGFGMLSAKAEGFVGRQAEVAAISRSFEGGAAGEANMTSLVGMPGIGKTALAVRWAQENAERFPGGIHFINAALAWGAGPIKRRSPLVVILRALGLPVPGDWNVTSMLSALRETVENRRPLIILDDVPSAAHVRHLLPGVLPAALLITSRRRMDGLVATHGARQIAVPALQTGESARLVACMGLREGAVAGRLLTERIIKDCEGHPLALRMASVASLQYPELFRHGDAGMLVMRDDIMGDEDYCLRSLFDQEYCKLPAEAADLFLFMAVMGERSLTVDEISAGCGISAAEAAHQLSVLCSHSFAQRSDHGRYTTHRIARSFARTVVTSASSGTVSVGGVSQGGGT